MDSKILYFTDENVGKEGALVYVDGSLLPGGRSGWGLPARIKQKVAGEQSGACRCTTSSTKMGWSQSLQL